MAVGYMFSRIKHWFFNKNEFEFEFGKYKQTREKSRKYNLKIFALCFPSSSPLLSRQIIPSFCAFSDHFSRLLSHTTTDKVIFRRLPSNVWWRMMMTCFGSTFLFASKFNRRVICQYVLESLSYQGKLINMQILLLNTVICEKIEKANISLLLSRFVHLQWI